MNAELQETPAHESAVWRASIPEDNPNPIVELDIPRQVLRYTNPAAAALFSDGPSSVFEHPFFTGLAEAAQPLVDGRAAIVRRDVALGERCYVQDLVYNPKIGALRVYAVDVTEIRRVESQMRERNVELEQLVAEQTSGLAAKSKELENLSYLVSHDLKAPLRGIDGYSRLLADEFSDKLDEEGRRFVRNIRSATLHIVQLIDDLLAYSRVERRILALSRVDLRGAIDSQLEQARPSLGGVRLEVDVGDLKVYADPTLLALVLQQLVDNAIKFTKKTEEAAIAIGAQADHGRCVLSIRDRGIGFDMRHHDKIFGIFQKLHRVEEFPGTGIGLALVRKAVERMGGKVWAEGQPAAGATFYVELPLSEGAG